MEIYSTPVNNTTRRASGSSGYASFCLSAGTMAAVAAVASSSSSFRSPPASATRTSLLTEDEVLDQVSRLTLDNNIDKGNGNGKDFDSQGSKDGFKMATMERMAFPMTPTGTPVQRKRKTTPIQLAPRDPFRLYMAMHGGNSSSSKVFQPKRLRAVDACAIDPIPMFPATPNESSRHTNVFSQHRPLFSPVERTSHVNMEFLAVLQERYQNTNQNVNNNNSQRTPSMSRRKVGTIPCDSFPTLDCEEEDGTSSDCSDDDRMDTDSDQSEQHQVRDADGFQVPARKKVLKMRRCAEEFALLATQTGL